MTKKFGALLIILLLSLTMVFQAGCGSKEDTTKTETKTETKIETKTEGTADTKAPQEKSKVMALGTHGVGSIVNAMGSGISTVLSRELGTEVKTVASSGPTEWMPMMNTEEMDMGVLNAWDAQMGYLGGIGYDKISGGKGFPIMLITSGHKSASGMMTSKESGIKTGADLKGKRYVGTYTGSPGQTMLADAGLANLGLTKKDVKMVSVPDVASGIRAIMEGRADVAGTANIGMGIVSELDAGKGAQFISLDTSPEAVKAMQELFPATPVKVSPGKGKTGVLEDIYLMEYDFYLVGRQKLSDDVVYNVVKALWDKNKDLGAINKNLEDWTPENFVVELFTLPYHPGAIKFYKEKGVWTPDMDKRQQELLASKK